MEGERRGNTKGQETSKQIGVYKTNTSLLELNNCMRPASRLMPWHIHAEGRKDEGGYSLIWAVMVDYKERENSVSVYANLAPELVKYLYAQMQLGVKEFSFFQQKIFQGENRRSGEGIVTCFSISRHVADSAGRARRMPWSVEIQNGTGRIAHNRNGGQFCEKDTYRKEKAVSVSLKDEDIFMLFARANAVICAFEQDSLFRRKNAQNFQKLYQMVEKLILTRAGAKDAKKDAA